MVVWPLHIILSAAKPQRLIMATHLFIIQEEMRRLFMVLLLGVHHCVVCALDGRFMKARGCICPNVHASSLTLLL